MTTDHTLASAPAQAATPAPPDHITRRGKFHLGPFFVTWAVARHAWASESPEGATTIVLLQLSRVHEGAHSATRLVCGRLTVWAARGA